MFSLFKALKKFHPNLSYQEIKTHKSKFDRGLRFTPKTFKWIEWFIFVCLKYKDDLF